MELDKQTVVAWRRFLSTEAGKDGLLWWREQTPSIAKGEPHEITFDAGKVEGYKVALDNLTFVLGAEPVKEINASNDT